MAIYWKSFEQNNKTIVLNPIQDGAGGAKSPAPPTSFSPVTPTNVEFSPKTF